MTPLFMALHRGTQDLGVTLVSIEASISKCLSASLSLVITINIKNFTSRGRCCLKKCAVNYRKRSQLGETELKTTTTE